MWPERSTSSYPAFSTRRTELWRILLDIYRSLNALAESIIGLFKVEVIRRLGPSRNVEDVEFATLEWVWWFNYHRLLGPIGHVPPAEYEKAYYQSQERPIEEVGLKENSLR
jgi:transposase InsO family protein